MVFDDLSKIKDKDYFAHPTNFFKQLKEKEGAEQEGNKNRQLEFLKGKAGIYMIYNKVTKKRYIGMSNNIKTRFYNYLNLKRLDEKNHSRIHKALLKYGLQNFSLYILELQEKRDRKALKKREDFFMMIFKPQYNIERSYFELSRGKFYDNEEIKRILPKKVKDLIKNCLDTKKIDWHILTLDFYARRGFYTLNAITPKHWIYANSLAWDQGNIIKEHGYVQVERKNSRGLEYSTIKQAYKMIDKKWLACFVHEGGAKFVNDSLKEKLKAIKLNAKKG